MQATGTIDGLSYYNGLEVGSSYSGAGLPIFHRAMAIPDLNTIHEHNEYVFVNRDTGIVKHYNTEEISQNTAMLHGISVLVLNESSLREETHGVLHSGHLGKPCFVSARLQDGLSLVVYEECGVRFNRKKSEPGRTGYHGLVVSVVAMTVDDLIARFSFLPNWSVCRFIADGAINKINEDTENDIFPHTPLDGVDTPTGKLMKVLNVFGKSLTGSVRRHALGVRNVINDATEKTWNELTASDSFSCSAYLVLFYLNRTVSVSEHVGTTIMIETLMDSLDRKYGFEEEWDIINLSERINKSLLLP